MSSDFTEEKAREIVDFFNAGAPIESRHDFTLPNLWMAEGFLAGLEKGRDERDAAVRTLELVDKLNHEEWEKDVERLVEAIRKAMEERIICHPQVEAAAMEDLEVALKPFQKPQNASKQEGSK